MKIRLFSLLFCISTILPAQDLKVAGSINAKGFVSSENELPFWMYTNTNKAIEPLTNAFIGGSFVARFDFKDHAIEGGTTLYLRDGVKDNLQRRDIYLRYTNRWLKMTLGAKKADTRLGGLSVSNQNFLFSNNARPLPGILIEAPEWVRISKGFYLDWRMGHYVMNDKRYVTDTWVHFKEFGMLWAFNDLHTLKFKIQHVAQWAGTSPVYGKLSSDFNTFVDVFFARRGDQDTTIGDQLNAVGNHLGSYYLEYGFQSSIGKFSMYHEHPFEDGSGTRLANFPDGIWGINFKPSDIAPISSVLYEYVTTKNQSGSDGGSGVDNYFNSLIYKSGWTYDSNIIGLPFFVFDPSLVFDENEQNPVIVNSVSAHHIGALGVLGPYMYQIKTSFVERFGTVFNPLDKSISSLHSYMKVGRNFNNLGTFYLVTGLDINSNSNTNVGAGVEYSYKF